MTTRVEWPRAPHRRSLQPPDPALKILEQIAHGIARRASDVLRSPVDVAFDPPVRMAAGGTSSGIFGMWRCDAGRDVVVWLTMTDAGARGLLAIVLGGPASAAFTALEREIVNETVERLIAGSGHSFEDGHETAARGAETWRMFVGIDGPSGANVRLEFNAPIAVPTTPPAVRCIEGDRIPIRIGAAISGSRTTLQSIAAWRVGTIVRLRESTCSIVLDVPSGPQSIGSGTLGTIRGRRAVRIGAEASPTL